MRCRRVGVMFTRVAERRNKNIFSTFPAVRSPCASLPSPRPPCVCGSRATRARRRDPCREKTTRSGPGVRSYPYKTLSRHRHRVHRYAGNNISCTSRRYVHRSIQIETAFRTRETASDNGSVRCTVTVRQNARLSGRRTDPVVSHLINCPPAVTHNG